MRAKEIKTTLFHPKTDKYSFLATLKRDSNYDSFRKITKGIVQHPFGKGAILATPLPQSYADLRRNSITPHSGNIESEIAWVVYSILEFSTAINRFIPLKEHFEKCILLNRYSEAENILDQIENEICFSNWGAENRLILLEEKEGTESNWLKLSQLSEEIKDPLSLFLTEQSSKKAEKKLTYTRYKANFESIIAGTSGLFNEYLCFRILYNAFTGFESFSFFMNVESVSSIIDRYNILIDLLVELVSQEKTGLVSKVLSELLPVFGEDKRLIQLNNMVTSNFKLLDNTDDISSFINQYSIGKYKYCIENSKELLELYPSAVELYIIYVKCLIEEKEGFIKTNASENIDEILNYIYCLYNLEDNFNNVLEDLFKISCKYSSFNFGKQLFPVIVRQTNYINKNKIYEFYFSVNSQFNNPIIINNVTNKEYSSIDSIAEGFRQNQDSIYSKINIQIYDGNVNGLAINEISKKRRQLYISKALFSKNKYDDLISHIEGQLNQEYLSVVTKKEMAEILFESYLEKNKLIEALSLYVELFFENKYFVHCLNNNRLLERLEELDAKVDSIDWPIFYYLSNPNAYDQYVKYDEYLEYENIERPTQLLGNVEIDKRKLCFFLKEICNVEVMHHSLYFSGTDDIENERINILKGLIAIDEENEGEFIKEITEITKKSTIRNAIREVNKGRITLNTQQLINKEERNIRDNFSRFKELVVFSNEYGIKSIDATSKMLSKYFDLLHDKDFRNKVVNMNDPAFVAFKLMFIELRDQFVLSKDFGLDGYLSTRIRHGTLLNHIRSNFEALNLVSQKSGDSYLDNSYWKKKIPANLYSKQKEIQDLIKGFSLKIDEFTEYIIKELIQVKTEKYDQKPNAYFDFSLTDHTLAILFKHTKDEIKSYSEFLDFVFSFLEKRVEVILKIIRERFNTVIKEKYSNLLNDYDRGIREIINGEPFVDFTNSIVKCQTNIQIELNNIAEWFNVSNPTSESILDVETIIQTAIEITNTIYPNQTINPKVQVDTKIPFSSGTTNLIYIFRIMLDNIIKHSGQPKTKRNITIYSDIKNDKSLIIKVSNDCSPDKLDEISSNLKQIKNEWDMRKNYFTKSNIEGGSGFEKIRRILTVDMEMDNYNFDYDITGNRLTIGLEIEIQLTTQY